jgi:hypothetical protein
VSERYAIEKKTLQEMEHKFSFLKKEYLEIQAQRAEEKYQRKKAQNVENYTLKAATLIQSVWRSYRVRKIAEIAAKKRRKKEKA